MADDSNKVVIELDLDTKQFTTKIGEVKTGLESAGEHGKSKFRELGEAALFFNEGLELVKKGVEAFEYAFQKMEAAEKMKNQEVALKNLGAQLGINTNTLTTAIKASTEGSISSLEAQKIAFELLNAKIKGENIPALVAYADKLEKSTGGQKAMTETLSAFARAIDTGSTKGLKTLGIEVEKTGNRQEILNLILEQTKVKSQALGTGYSEVADKMKAKSKDLADSVTKYLGETATNVFAMFAGDKVDKASLALDSYKEKLKQISEAQAAGKNVIDLPGITRGYVSLGEARQEVEKKIAATQERVNELRHEETKEQEKLNSELKQERELKSLVSASDQKKVELAQQERLYTELAAKEQSSGTKSLQVTQGLYASKRALLEEQFRREMEIAGSVPQTAGQYAAKVIEIERRKYAAIQALRVDDQTYAEMRRNAELKAIESGNFDIENAASKHQEILLQQEDDRFRQEQERARNDIKDKEQLNLQLELLETQHQKNISAIKDKSGEVSAMNAQMGWHQAMAQMKKDNLDFAAVTAKMTVGTSNLMTKSFVEAAKGHGNAMEMMKQQFMEMIGTQAIQSGSVMMLESVWPPNPSGLAAGAGLVALGSALVGASGGGASASGGGGGGVGGEYSPQQAQQNELQRKSAQITINGDYLNSRETQLHLATVLRENSDITDYAIVAQGKNY